MVTPRVHLYLGKMSAREKRSETVLLVEDEAAVRRLTRRVLEREGYRVLEADGPAAALDAAARYPDEIALLLTDVIMPGGGGPQLYLHLVQDRPRLRVLFTSGFGDHVLAQGGLDDDQPFLAKPYTPGVLLDKIRGILDPS